MELPRSWQAELGGYAAVPQVTGRSDAVVIRLAAPGRPTVFLKSERTGAHGEVVQEAARLRWLADAGIPCPRVLAEAQEQGRNWLLMSRVRGADLASSPGLEHTRIAELAAVGLRRLHRLEIADCPFDGRIGTRIAQARIRLEAGLVDEDDFDEDHRRCPAAALFERLEAEVPDHEDLVVAHGDACLSNLMADEGGFSGFVDCARLGVAVRHQDLALAMRSIAHDLGEEYLPVFLKNYRMPADEQKIAFFRLLDEFF